MLSLGTQDSNTHIDFNIVCVNYKIGLKLYTRSRQRVTIFVKKNIQDIITTTELDSRI